MGCIMNSYFGQNCVYGDEFANTVLAAYKTVPGGALIIGSSTIRLSSDPAFNPTPGTTIASLTPNEATFSGYTAPVVALSAPLNQSPVCAGILNNVLFIATTGTPFVSGNVYGWWIDDGTNFIAGERFANGGIANFSEPGDFLDLTAVLPLQLQQATS